MSVSSKIIFGLLATILLAWLLSGPLKFAQQCKTAPGAAAAAKSPDAKASAMATTGPAATAPSAAPPVAVTRCQSAVDTLFQGKTIGFASGGTVVAAESGPLVNTLAESLRSCDQVIVEVAGHTDAQGDASVNLRLSEERANSVVQALVAAGVPGDRLIPKGYGETRPVDPANSEAAHARNRRIEFQVTSASATAGS